SNSKDKSQTEERSSNRALQEKSSNKVKRTQTEKLIDISPWVKYTKREINLELEPKHFINRSKESSISPEKVRSLRSKKEKIRVIIEEPREGKANVSIRIKWIMTKRILRAFITYPHDKEAWAKKEEEILDSIKEELKQKKKIDLGSNWLREVFISRNKEEYRNRHMNGQE
ncbi:6334_t:CDS:2, partial [Gigaspora margarita]